jgi:hypothetical protein
MSNEKALVNFDPDKGFIFHDLDSMYRTAECFIQSGFAPRGMDTPQKLIVCWATAAELGIRPLQAVQGMNVINGRLGIGGDLGVAKVRGMGLLVETPKKKYSGTIGQDDYTCTVTLHRKGEDPQDFSFSIKEAKIAGIYKNNWPLYPQRMVYYRALGFGLRDMFSDVLKGLYTTEELEDFQDETPPWLADEAKIAANQALEAKAKAAGAKFVESVGKKPSPKEAVEPAFAEDRTKPAAAKPRTPPFAEKLKEDFPEPAPQPKVAELKEDFLPPKPVPQPEDTGKDQLGTQQWPPQEEKAQEPDDLDMTPAAAPPTAPAARPEWMDYVIKSIPHRRFFGRRISELEPADLAKIETQWIPKIEADMDNANADQRIEYAHFQSAIAHSKATKPF